MIESFETVMWILGVLFLIVACVAVNKSSKGIAVIAFIAGVFILSTASFIGGTGYFAYIDEKHIPANQLYLLESDLKKSSDNEDVLVLMTPIPVEAVLGNTTAYVTNVIRNSPYYYKIPKDVVDLGLVKGDIAIKKDGKLQKFEPLAR